MHLSVIANKKERRAFRVKNSEDVVLFCEILGKNNPTINSCLDFCHSFCTLGKAKLYTLKAHVCHLLTYL